MNREPIILQRVETCPYDKSYGYIYLITNKLNGHKYVGKHVYRHPYVDKGYWASGGLHLKNALLKENNDKEKFKYEILDWIYYDSEKTERELSLQLANLEEFYIEILGTYKNSDDYNETPGGDSWRSGSDNPMYDNHMFAGENHPMYGVKGSDNPRTGTKHTDSAKKLMSEKAKQRDISGSNNPMYGVRKFGKDNPFYGKHHTVETKEKIRQSKLKCNTDITGEKNPMYGKHHTAETKEKMRNAQLGSKSHNFGKHMSEETKEKMRQSLRGRVLTDEHKEKLKLMWNKPINQYDSNGNLIKEFQYGALSIGRNLKLSGKKIYESCCIEDFELIEGYRWKFRT